MASLWTSITARIPNKFNDKVLRVFSVLKDLIK